MNHNSIFCPHCERCFSTRAEHDNGYTYYSCTNGHEWFRLTSQGPPPSIQYIIDNYVSPGATSIITIEGIMDVKEVVKMREAMEFNPFAKLTDHQMQALRQRSLHPKSRIVLLPRPGVGKSKALHDVVDQLDSTMNCFRRHLSDIPLDTDYTPNK